MKKKVLILLIVAVLAVAPAMAASTRGSSDDGSFGIGLNLGTNTGVGLKFGFGDFDVLANIGLDNFRFNPFSLGGDVAVSYEVYDFDFGRGHHMPLTVGVGASMGFVFDDPFVFDLAVLVPVGISYQIPDFPMQFYLRLAPGLAVLPELDFAFAGYIGALWMF